MKKIPIVFRGYIEFDKSVNEYVGVCIDLCLGVQASSIEEAKRKLHEQISDYLQDAIHAPEEERLKMFYRRAPLSFHLRYYQIKAKLLWAHLRNRKASVARYNENLFNTLHAA